MSFNTHSDLVGKHAFLSASKYHWVNYTPEKMEATFRTAMAAERGTALHDLAQQHIRLKIRMPRNKSTLNAYINDAIGFRMTPEQVLFYSPNAFGTADAISFHKNFLRIHDLKTGVTPASMTQLKIYEAFFCLEYRVKPHLIESELRIYQNDEILIEVPDPDEILHLMDVIKSYDALIDNLKKEDGEW